MLANQLQSSEKLKYYVVLDCGDCELTFLAVQLPSDHIPAFDA